MAGEGSTRFLNVDFELVTTGDIDALLAHLAAKTIVLRDSRRGRTRTVWLELSGPARDVNHTLVKFAALIERLPRNLRARWNACKDRCANVGIQAGATPHAARFKASAEVIAQIARLGARIEITVYGAATGPNAST